MRIRFPRDLFFCGVLLWPAMNLLADPETQLGQAGPGNLITFKAFMPPAPLGDFLGESASGLFVYQIAESRDLVSFHPETGDFHRFGPVLSPGELGVVSGDYFVGLHPQTRQGQSWHIGRGERSSQFTLAADLQVAGLLHHPERQEHAMLLLRSAGDPAEAQVTLHSLHASTGQVGPVTATLLGDLGEGIFSAVDSGLQVLSFQARPESPRVFLRRFGDSYLQIGRQPTPLPPIVLESGLLLSDAFLRQNLLGSTPVPVPGRDLLVAHDLQVYLLDPLNPQHRVYLAQIPPPSAAVRPGQPIRNSLQSNAIGSRLVYFRQNPGNPLYVAELDAAAIWATHAPRPSLDPLPLPPVIPGETWTHRIQFLEDEASPSRSVLTPEGMTLQQDGTLRFEVPDRHLGPLEIKIQSESGREPIHLLAPSGVRTAENQVSPALSVLGFDVPHRIVPTDGIVDHVLPVRRGETLLLGQSGGKIWSIFDFPSGQVTGRLALESDAVLVAAGEDRAAAYLVDRNVFQFFDLPEGRLVQEFPNPLGAVPQQLFMGRNQRRFLLAVRRDPAGDARQSRMHMTVWILDLEGDQPVSATRILQDLPASPEATIAVCPRMNFVKIRLHTQLFVLHVNSGEIREVVSTSASPILNSWLLDGGIFPLTHEQLVDARLRPFIIQHAQPAVAQERTTPQRTHFMADAEEVPLLFETVSLNHQAPVLRLLNAGDFSPIHTLPALPNFLFRRSSQNRQFSYHPFWPMRQVVFVPTNQPGLILLKMGVEDLPETVPPYLLLPSLPDFLPGQVYSFQPITRSDVPPLELLLEEGPEGAALLEDGSVSWTPPVHQSQAVTFTLSLQDGRGNLSRRSATVHPGIPGLDQAVAEDAATVLRRLDATPDLVVTASDSPYLVLVNGTGLQSIRSRDLSLFQSVENALPASPLAAVIRGNYLLAAVAHTIHVFELPGLEKQAEIRLDLAEITDLAAPRGTRMIFAAGQLPGEPANQNVLNSHSGVFYLEPASGRHARLEGVEGHLIRMSVAGDRLFTIAYQQRSMQTKPPGARFSRAQTHWANTNFYRLEDRRFIPVWQRAGPGRITNSLSSDSRLVWLTMNFAQEKTPLNSFQHLVGEDLAISQVYNVQRLDVLSYHFHPQLPLAVELQTDSASLLRMPPGLEPGRALTIPESMISLQQAFWTDQGERILLQGRSPQSTDLLFTMPAPLSQPEKASLQRPPR